MTTEARFWSKVAPMMDDRGCWEWTGATRNGYGKVRIGPRPGRVFYAHRLAYTFTHGVEPGDLDVCHACDNPGCVNPAHLFLGTHEDNMRDRDAKGRNINHVGEDHGRAILTNVAVRQIRSSKEPARILAARFGVCEKTIYQVRQRKAWAHLA